MSMIERDRMRGLGSVRLDKEKLVETVKKNRDEHRQIFLEALDGWEKEVTKELTMAARDARKGVYRLRFNLPRPEDHTKDYERVLKMLDLSLDDELELTAQEFQQFVMDDWGWQRDFLETASSYSAMAVRKGRDL